MFLTIYGVEKSQCDRSISLVKTIENLSKAMDYLFSKYLCCKTEHKTQLNFSQRQKILKCLWSKNFELQKCGHTGKSNYGLNLSIILMFLTFYGVEKSQCDHSNCEFSTP